MNFNGLEICCDTTDDHKIINSTTIHNSGTITTSVLHSTTANITNLSTGDINNTTTIATDIIDSKQSISRHPQFRGFGGVHHPNFHAGYNTNNNLFYVFIPTANAWRDPQDTLSLTINKINNADIVVGSRWKSRMG